MDFVELLKYALGLRSGADPRTPIGTSNRAPSSQVIIPYDKNSPLYEGQLAIDVMDDPASPANRLRNVPDDGTRRGQATLKPARNNTPPPAPKDESFWDKLSNSPDLGDALTTFGLSLLAADAPGAKGFLQNLATAGLNTKASVDRNQSKRAAAAMQQQAAQINAIEFAESVRQFEKMYGAKIVQAAIDSVDPSFFPGDQKSYYEAVQQRLEALSKYTGGGGQMAPQIPRATVNDKGQTTLVK